MNSPYYLLKDKSTGEKWRCLHNSLHEHVACIEGKANAAHIVKCVNAHEELVAALSYALNLLKQHSIYENNCILNNIEQALDKAEAT